MSNDGMPPPTLITVDGIFNGSMADKPNASKKKEPSNYTTEDTMAPSAHGQIKKPISAAEAAATAATPAGGAGVWKPRRRRSTNGNMLGLDWQLANEAGGLTWRIRPNR